MRKLLIVIFLSIAFLNYIKAQDTITTTSGLKYLIIERGTGQKVEIGYEVVIDIMEYLDGKKLYSGETSFILGKGGEKGLKEGISLMNVGDKFRLIVPPELAFGEKGSGVIPPNATIVYDVKLLSAKAWQTTIKDEFIPNKTSAMRCQLLRYNFGYDYYTVIIPASENKSSFPLISKNPLTSFLFVENMNEEKIHELTVRQLKTRTFSGYSTDAFFPMEAYAYSLYFIQGFEKYYEELKTIDEFDLAERKEEFLNKLVECWNNYHDEYLKFSAFDLNIEIGFNADFELNNEYKVLGDDYFKAHIGKALYIGENYTLSKDNYNFDKQEMNFPFPLLVGSYGAGISVWNWNKIISSNLSDEILTITKKRFYTESISPYLAKKLIEPKIQGYSNFVVKLDNGFSNYYGNGGMTYLQKFNIISVTVAFAKFDKNEWQTPIYIRTFQNQ